MDIGRAFNFVFEDDEWVKKILIGGAILLIPFVGFLIAYGFMIEVARRAFHGTAIDEFPEWDDIGGYLSRGFFFWLATFLWVLPFILLFMCGFLIVILLGVGTGEEAVIGVSIVLFYLVLIPMIFLLSIAAAVITPVLLGRYAYHQRFGAMFEFSEIIADVRRIGLAPMVLLTGVYLAAGYLGQFGIILCFIGVVFTTFYGNVAAAHAAGQTYRLAQGLEPFSPAAPRPAAQ